MKNSIFARPVDLADSDGDHDDQGDLIPISETSGMGDASLTISKKLTSASASATVLLTICTFDEDGNET